MRSNQAEEERLRQEASLWFARMRAQGADAHRAAFETWCSDAANRQAYERLVRRFDESVILGDSRLSALRLSAVRSSRRRSNAATIATALAACIVASIAVGGWLWRAGNATPYSTAVGQIRTIALRDGATMILDTDSAATASIRKNRQIVQLERGRARFIAAQRGLAVRAANAELDAKEGATFDLALAAPDQVEVTVLAGAPRLSRRGGEPDPAGTSILAAGRQMRIGPKLVIGQIMPASQVEASWPSGLRRFDMTSLGEVVSIANRYNTRKIRFADPAIGRLRVSGVFRVTGSENLAKALAAAFGLTAAPAGGDIVLSRAAA